MKKGPAGNDGPVPCGYPAGGGGWAEAERRLQRGAADGAGGWVVGGIWAPLRLETGSETPSSGVVLLQPKLF